METFSLVPIISSVVKVKVCPLSSTVFPPSISFRRISGPLVSSKVAICNPSSPLIFITRSNLFLCSSCEPCEKLNRATFMPASMISRSFSSLSLDGPKVQIILVFLIKSPFHFDFPIKLFRTVSAELLLKIQNNSLHIQLHNLINKVSHIFIDVCIKILIPLLFILLQNANLTFVNSLHGISMPDSLLYRPDKWLFNSLTRDKKWYAGWI